MKRIKVLLGQRRFQVLVTMALLLLAVSVVIGSGANFTATSANPGNVFTAGALSIGNFKSDGSTPNGGSLIENLTASNMKPTDSISGTAVIKNTGTVSGTFTLTGALVAGYDPTFASVLHLKVVEDGTTTIYDGAFAGFSAINLTSGTPWAAGAAHTYVFTVNWTSNAADNSCMGKSATIGFTWNAAQS